MFRAPAEGPGSEVAAAAAAAAASPNSYVDAIRTGLDANTQEQSEIQKTFGFGRQSVMSSKGVVLPLRCHQVLMGECNVARGPSLHITCHECILYIKLFSNRHKTDRLVGLLLI